MAQLLETKIDTNAEYRQIQKMLANSPALFNRISNRAATKSANKMRTIGRREMRQSTGLKGKMVNRLIQKYKPPREGTAIGYINEQIQIPLENLNHKVVPGGIQYLRADGETVLVEDAFVSSFRHTEGQIWCRVEGDRYPIKRLFYKVHTDEITERIVREKVARRMLTVGIEVYNSEISRLAQLAIAKGQVK